MADRREDIRRGIDEFNRGWARQMVEIWREKIERLRLNDTQQLSRSVKLSVLKQGPQGTTIEHQFWQYGIYVAAGVGKGYSHGNGGDLKFLAKDNEVEQRQVGAGLSRRAMFAPKYKHITTRSGDTAALTRGTHREKADWAMRKYYASLMKLGEENAAAYGQAYQGLVSTFLERLFGGEIRMRM